MGLSSITGAHQRKNISMHVENARVAVMPSRNITMMSPFLARKQYGDNLDVHISDAPPLLRTASLTKSPCALQRENAVGPKFKNFWKKGQLCAATDTILANRVTQSDPLLLMSLKPRFGNRYPGFGSSAACRELAIEIASGGP